MLDDGRGSILFPPSGGLGDDMPPLIPFFYFRLERFVVVQADDGGIHNGIGHGSDRDRCVGNGGCHRLGHGRDEDPEDIGSDGQSRSVFIVVVLMPLCPNFHFLPSLIGHFISWA